MFWVTDELSIVDVFSCVVVMDELDMFSLFLLTELSVVTLWQSGSVGYCFENMGT